MPLVSRATPYRPDPQAPPPSFDHMAAVLAKHRGKVDVQPEPHSPHQRGHAGLVADDPQPRLQWEKPERGAMGVRTLCGKYSAAKIVLGDRTTYECWILVPGAWFRQLAVGLESFAQVKDVAEQHARSGNP